MKKVKCEVCEEGTAVLEVFGGDSVPLLMYKCRECGTEWASAEVTRWNLWLAYSDRHHREITGTTVTYN